MRLCELEFKPVKTAHAGWPWLAAEPLPELIIFKRNREQFPGWAPEREGDYLISDRRQIPYKVWGALTSTNHRYLHLLEAECILYTILTRKR
jgi:hypothetical protein